MSRNLAISFIVVLAVAAVAAAADSAAAPAVESHPMSRAVHRGPPDAPTAEDIGRPAAREPDADRQDLVVVHVRLSLDSTGGAGR